MIKKLSECPDIYLHQGNPRRIAPYRDRHRGAREAFQVSPDLLSRYERGAYVSIDYRYFEVAIRRVGRNSFTAVVLTQKGPLKV
jgi:hypothetical protein